MYTKLTTAILGAILLGNVSAVDVYAPRVDYQLKYGSRLINRLNVLLPVLQTESELLFADVAGVHATKKGIEGNFGLGYRSLSSDYIVGGYGFVDIKRSKNNNTFTQFTVGAELLFSNHEYRINGYLPVTGKKYLSGKLASEEQASDTSFTVNAHNSYEVARYGFDVEGGLSLISDTPSLLNLYGAYYYFGAKEVVGMHGCRLRLEYSPIEYLSLSAEYSYDNIRKSNYYAGLKLCYNFDTVDTSYNSKARLQQKMTQAIVRDVDIMITAEVEKLPLTKKLDKEGRTIKGLSINANGEVEVTLRETGKNQEGLVTYKYNSSNGSFTEVNFIEGAVKQQGPNPDDNLPIPKDSQSESLLALLASQAKIPVPLQD